MTINLICLFANPYKSNFILTSGRLRQSLQSWVLFPALGKYPDGWNQYPGVCWHYCPLQAGRSSICRVPPTSTTSSIQGCVCIPHPLRSSCHVRSAVSEKIIEDYGIQYFFFQIPASCLLKHNCLN